MVLWPKNSSERGVKSFEYFVLEKIDKKGKIVAVVRVFSGMPE